MALWDTLLLAFLFVTVGFIGGALTAIIFLSRQEKKPDSSARKEGGVERRKYKNLTNLYREKSSGNLLLEIGGKPYRDGNQLSKKDQEELANLAKEWLSWLGKPLEMPARLETFVRPPEPTLQPAAPLAFPSAPAQMEAIPPPPVGRSVTGDKPVVEELKKPAAITIVGQIDEILQERLAGTPLEERGIRIAEDVREGVVVWIGTKRYIGVEGVPDLDVRGEIKAAVATWERRMDRNRT
ncbi:MAG: hypothetical protein IT308_11930 [Anaerolineaceae bacterium]|nr:hypothetical protein [Anaerolineaceae bacterium]